MFKDNRDTIYYLHFFLVYSVETGIHEVHHTAMMHPRPSCIEHVRR